MNGRRRWSLAGAICAVTALAYLPSLRGEFQFDDNDIFSSPGALDPSTFLSPAGWTGRSRPLTALSFALDHALGGFAPLAWHATNVAIHLAAALLAWLLARRLLARVGLGAGESTERTREWAALAVASIFALHPLQTEAVSYVSQRAEALASGLYLAALLALLAREEAADRGRRTLLLVAAVALHALALLAKPMAATMPAAWLLVAALLPPPGEQELPWHQRVARRLPAALPLLGLSLAAAASGLGSTGGGAGGDHAGFGVSFVTPVGYLATQLRAIPRYLGLLLLPIGQNVDWDFPFSRSLLEPAAVAGAAFVVLVTAAALGAVARWHRSRPASAGLARLAAFAWLFFLLVLAPTTLIPLRDPFVEHRLYLALLGPALLLAATVAAGAAALGPRRGTALAVLLAAVAVAGAFAGTWRRNHAWQSPLALWSDAAARSPGKIRVWVNLGASFSLLGRAPEAVDAYDRALALPPDPGVRMDTVMHNLATALISLRRYDDARDRLLRYLQETPGDTNSHVTLATVELAAGRLDAAEAAALRALRMAPDLAPPRQVLGQVWEKRGNKQAAWALYAEAARIDPASPIHPYSMARIAESEGRVQEACALYAKAAAASPTANTAKWARQAFAEICGR